MVAAGPTIHLYVHYTSLISLETYLDLCIFLCHSLLTLVFHFCHLRWGGGAGRATGRDVEVGGMAWLSNIPFLIFLQLSASYKKLNT